MSVSMVYGLISIPNNQLTHNVNEVIRWLRRSYPLSWKPGQGDSLNLPDHRYKCRYCSLIPAKSDSLPQVVSLDEEEGFESFQEKYEHAAGPSGEQAVALRAGSDLSAFYRCGRTDPNQNTGIVIQKCKINATADLQPVQASYPTYLGRPWKEYSRTVVMQSSISDVIVPAGWYPWDGEFALSTYYREYQNTGPGADTSNRVTWPGWGVITNTTEAESFTAGNFIDGGNWLSSTGFPSSLASLLISIATSDVAWFFLREPIVVSSSMSTRRHDDDGEGDGEDESRGVEVMSSQEWRSRGDEVEESRWLVVDNLFEVSDAKITIRSFLGFLRDVKKKLEEPGNEKRNILFRATVFGKWLDILAFANDNLLLNYIFHYQVSTEPSVDCPHITYNICGNNFEFGRNEFCLITGFLFGTLPKKETYKATIVFMGRETRYYISDNVLELVDDLPSWNTYPW
nr:pectinesterase inhibitor domain, pectin lyase fold/virulence factor [Tanacetum cinerariifolium]